MNCDPIARWYRFLERGGFGRALERCRLAFLGEIRDAKRILVLGEGDGRFLVRLVEQNASASIDYVDLSGRMLELARERAGTGRVTYHQGNALTIPLPEGEFDLVCTHFFLDCLNERDAAALVARAGRASARNARWLVSEFDNRQWWHGVIVGGLYLFFRIATGLKTRRLVRHFPLLEKAGFHLEMRRTAIGGLLVSELWSRMESPESRCGNDQSPLPGSRGSL